MVQAGRKYGIIECLRARELMLLQPSRQGEESLLLDLARNVTVCLGPLERVSWSSNHELVEDNLSSSQDACSSSKLQP